MTADTNSATATPSTRINLDMLKATALFASKEQTRYYLNGVYIEMLPRGVRYVATNGHSLFACFDALPDYDPDNTLLGSMIIPLDKCVPFKKIKSADFAVMTGTLSKPEVSYFDSRLGFTPVDGEYPNWRRFLPAPNFKTEDNVTFNTEYLHAFTKAGKLLGIGAPKWLVSGDNPSAVWFDSDVAFGIIMPVRVKWDCEGRTTPSWVG